MEERLDRINELIEKINSKITDDNQFGKEHKEKLKNYIRFTRGLDYDKVDGKDPEPPF